MYEMHFRIATLRCLPSPSFPPLFGSEAVTVGLHRVGQTLVLDGNLGEVLVPVKAPVPAPSPNAASGPTPSRNHSDDRTSHRDTPNPAAMVGEDCNDDKVGADEGRWVMVGRGGKPQRDENWVEEEAEASEESNATMAAARHSSRETRGSSWENMGGWRQQGGDGDWSIHQGSWPALGTTSTSTSGAFGNSGLQSIVPSRPRGALFGGHPPEPPEFWRAFLWELAGMRLMLGSSLQVIRP